MTIHIHKIIANKGMVRILCKNEEELPGTTESAASFYKATCIKCAKVLLAETISSGNLQKQKDICMRFKLRPMDLL
jgi:hypothetical protein